MKKLAPLTMYYIRKLLRKEQGSLKCIVVDGACLAVNPESDLNAVLESLYLDAEEVAAEVLHLETLVMSHQMIGESRPAEQLEKVEAEIFWVLGLKKVPLSSERSGPGTRVGIGMTAFSY